MTDEPTTQLTVPANFFTAPGQILRMTAQGPISGIPVRERTGPETGHQFHFAVTVQGSYQVGDDPNYYDCEPDPHAEPFRLTVRAWCLADACRRAAEIPLGQWTHPGEELT